MTNRKSFWSNLYKQEPKNFYSNNELKTFTNNKIFWITVKSPISESCAQSSKITLVDKTEEKTGDSSNEIISDDMDVANTLKKTFRMR